MVNHVRTLLYNRDGQGFGTDLLEEYTPPEYRVVALPGYLQAAHDVLYGVNPSTATRLYRLRQFMLVLSATRLQEYVTSVDPRVTYDDVLVQSTRVTAATSGTFPADPGVTDLGDVTAALATLGEPVLVSLFGAAPEEPYRTWKNLWESDMPLPYRLGAVLLAVATRTDEIRQADITGN